MLDVAIDAAKKAGDHAYSYFKNLSEFSRKQDRSPVTRADIEAEQIAKKIILKKFPDHDFVGEEEETEISGVSPYKWIVDPIDGTRDFIRGLGIWCTLLAVLKNDEPIIGIAYFPDFNELYSAQKGKGAYLNGKKISVSSEKSLEESFITLSSAQHFSLDQNKPNQYHEVCIKADMNRSLGSWGFALVFKGVADAYIAGRGKIWDFAALAVLCEEAGGRWTDFSGEKKLDTNSIILSNGLIHDQVLKILNS